MKIICWVGVVPGVVWALVRVIGWERGGAVQLLAFTPYVAGWAVLVAVVALVARRWWAGGVGVLVAVTLAVCVLPRGLPADRGPVDGVELRVMTANMLFGGADPGAIVALVRSGDVSVLALQEFTEASRAALTGAGLDALLPYASFAAEAGASGSALYSRYPVSAAGSRRNGGGFRQAYATITPPGAVPLIAESAHPRAPSEISIVKYWRADLAAEPRADPAGPPRILLGDFNATLDHAFLRDLISSGYRDAGDVTGRGFATTWGPYDGDLIPPVTIDHVLVDERIGVRDLWVHPLPHSDHRTVVASLTVPGK